MYIRNPGHMTKMAVMPIYDKNPSKIFFSRTSKPISTKLGMKHRWLKHFNVYINHGPVIRLSHSIWQRCTMPGIFVGIYFLEASTLSY